MVGSHGSTRGDAAIDGSMSGVSTAFSDRVRLFLKVLTIINTVFSTVGHILYALGMDPTPDELAAQRIWITWITTAANALMWFAIARSKHSVRTALLTEAIATLGLAFVYSYLLVALNPAPRSGDAVASVLLTTILLVLRSSLVPSPVFATIMAGLLSMSATLGVVFTHTDELLVFQIWQSVMAAVIVAVTTVTTYTIYGLQRRVQVAKQLGQYQLERRIGQGGMGEVFLANHSLLQRPTAIKLLRDVRSSSARARFRQEVQTASGLTHPNTVEIYDYGRTADGVFYFAMEYVEGASLENAVLSTGAMPPSRVTRILTQAAGSLAEAHGRGLVHRDIKPSNLMLCDRGGDFDTLKVLDFGLVRDLSDDETASTSGLTGTPLYMAPEAILDPDGFMPESDVYALGATAYFLLTGEPPFASGSLVEVLADHLATEPPRPESSDEELAALVVRCLSKDPADRPADGAALLAALEACPCHGEWTREDARVWWEEHREQVDAAQNAEGDSFASARVLARRSSTSASTQASS